jgi:hypothetical protein
MAQFSHSDFGGMSQWSPGMTMVGDMFNSNLKSKLDAICTVLATYAAETPLTDRGNGREDGEVSYQSSRERSSWWERLVQSAHRMTFSMQFSPALEDWQSETAAMSKFTTLNHRIFGVAQAQSAAQTLTFNSQDALVRVSDLRKV